MSAGKVDVLAAFDYARKVIEVADRVSPLPAVLADHDKARAAVAELIAADRSYDEARAAYSALAPEGLGELDSRTDADYAPLAAAIQRRAAALVRVQP